MPAPDTSLRDIATCPACGQAFTRAGRRIWCSDACKQAAWRRRNPPPAAPQLPPARHRRDHTVYECCDASSHAVSEYVEGGWLMMPEA
jgi:hypothetical protein